MPQTPGFTLIADPKVLAIPIVDNREPLVDLRAQDSILIGPSPEIDDNQDYTFVRQGVQTRLLAAQALLPKHLRLCLYEGLRSESLQKALFDHRWQTMADLHPQLNKEELFYEVIKMVSPVVNLDGSANIPPHATGAAVDVYLLDADSLQAVDMGIHPKDWLDDPEGALSSTHSLVISAEAAAHRQTLNQVMSKVGFINYPTEYWHWSFGDRYWAFCTGNSHACYGVAAKATL